MAKKTKKPTIAEIKRNTKKKAPYFFDAKTMNIKSINVVMVKYTYMPNLMLLTIVLEKKILWDILHINIFQMD